jgi:ABC-2 type transport system ATP-binding protein
VPAIAVRDVRRTYTSTSGFFAQRRVVREALRGVSLEVAEGELFGLLGPNGAGKTTLVKVLSTVLLPSAGSVEILGHDAVRETKVVRALIGLVFGGERGLYGTLTGRDTLLFWADLYKLDPHSVRRRVDEVLELVGLTARADERVETYSRGMKQRLHLARGILHEPKLVLLDEPTIGLDPVAAAELRAIVRRLNDGGTTVFLTTHYMAEAETLCKRVAFINEGQIVLLDSPQALTRAAGERVVLEVTVGRAMLAALRGELEREGSLEVSELGTEGDLVSARISAPRAELGRLLVRVGAHDPSRLTMVEPSLEDVYLRLLGDRGMRV